MTYTDRAALSARLWAVAEHNIVAEWICCEPINPDHDLCVQGDATRRMVKALLVDDPEAIRPAPLLDAVVAEQAAADRAAILQQEADRIRAHCPDHLDSDSQPGSWMACHCDVADDLLRRLADAASGPGRADGGTDDEGDELVCVDMCGSCDACGMEPFGTPAEGWRQAAHFLRRTARASGNRAGSLHAANLIETELRSRAEASGPGRADCETQQPQRNIQCADAFWTKQPHAPHDWQQRPDAAAVHCPGVADETQQDETQAPVQCTGGLIMPTSSGGFTGISLAGRWECGNCGASGDGWYDEDDGLVLHDENGQPITTDEHDCEED